MLKHRELIRRVGWSLLIVAIYQLGQKITLPMIDPAVAKASLEGRTLLQNFGILTGSQFTLPTLFSLGIGPFMTGMIIWQAISSLGLDAISHLSQRQVSYIQKWIALGLAALQAIQIVYFIKNALITLPIFGNSKMATMAVVYLMLLSGTMLSIFLGDLLSQHGLGGSSLLILPGVILGLPNMITSGWGPFNYSLSHSHLVTIGLVTVVVLYILEFLMHTEQRLKVQRPMMQGDLTESYLPLRILSAGAMPFMFSMSLFRLPRMIFSTPKAANTPMGEFFLNITDYHSWAGVLTYAIVLMFLGYAFGLITVQPGQLAKSMKESGEYFLNIFPGEQTTSFLFRKYFVVTSFGNIFLVMIGVAPMILSMIFHDRGIANYSAYFGSLAILVSIMDNVAGQFKALYQKNDYHLF